jgi:hypothetical protein
VLLEFDQLLNLLFPRTGKPLALNEPMVDNAMQGFCRDVTGVMPASDLRTHAINSWLQKREADSRSEVAKSLFELLDERLPLRQ